MEPYSAHSFSETSWANRSHSAALYSDEGLMQSCAQRDFDEGRII